jgi:glyoxylase-like metal-dependent hydrolase (beta-lactamase superfamily II)
MTAELTFNREMDPRYGEAVEVAPGIHRIVANNPSGFTFHGTNTYVLGRTELTVIDPGPDDEDHRDAILAFAAGRAIRQIVLTHTHKDHSAGLPALSAASGARTAGYGPVTAPRGIAHEDPRAQSFFDHDFRPDRVLREGDRIACDGIELETFYTPGHAPDHLCFAVTGRRLLFSGDHVMGWNTSVVAPPEGHMGDYIASLERLLARDEEAYLSGHGETIARPQRMVKAYIVHRKMREQMVLDAIRAGNGTIAALLPKVYPTVSGEIASAAALSLLAHIQHLIEKKLVACDGSPTVRSFFSASSS